MIVWERVDETEAHELLDFAGARPKDLAPVAPGQLRGAVALYNRLSDRRLAWLADEVGMGKTFVALGAVALLRHQNPTARVLFIVPSSRLQAKWRKEIALFTKSCIRDIDHRARTFQGLPARPVLEPDSLYQFAAEMAVDSERDVLATMSSFSFALGDDPGNWRERWRELGQLAPALQGALPEACYREKSAFKKAYAAALNLILPSFDLVVCDESHNLRAGPSHDAARNSTMALALGGADPQIVELPWGHQGTPRVARLLCLTATPVERSYEELARQAAVFGMDRLPDMSAEVQAQLSELRGSSGNQDARKDIARRFVIRRLQELRPTSEPIGQGLTKNQYRREWRQGGVEAYDAEMAFASDREKLMVALVQKRVVELLHESGTRAADGTFLPSFQMGMLSSFESFSETISKKVKKDEVVYDGDEQTADPSERKGLDSEVVDQICRSYRATFGMSPPHPKMDQVAARVAAWAENGDKTLVFVRRVRSTEELANKISEHLDRTLIERFTGSLPPKARNELATWLARWDDVRRRATIDRALAVAGDDDDDSGSADSFFAWFFRGGKEAHQIGAKMRRDMFRSAHPCSVFFHDNHVLWLFDNNVDALSAWAAGRMGKLVAGVRVFVKISDKPDFQHLYEAWQASALRLLADEHGRDSDIGRVADDAQARIYPRKNKDGWGGDTRPGEGWLIKKTLFSLLRESELCGELWPEASKLPANPPDLANREVRRELMASTIRLGHPFIDLWITAVNLVDSFAVTGTSLSAGELAKAFLERLANQRDASTRRHDAWHELAELAEHHDLLMNVNFSDVDTAQLDALNRYFQKHLSRQSPALAMHGGSKSAQALTQFRMPGYPMVLVATDVLQEGVDLHTFCGRVVHYGIAHTSSATEQRTGRVDRIGSQAHRRFQREDPGSHLQIHYPHLTDTVEPLQLRELYRRMDLFLRLVHDGLGSVDDESSRVSLQSGMVQDSRYPSPPVDRLKTAFEVIVDGPDSDIRGGPLERVADIPPSEEALGSAINSLLTQVRQVAGERRWRGEYSVPMKNGKPRRQPLVIAQRTRRDGRGAYLRVESPIGFVDLSDGKKAGKLLRWQSRLVGVTITIHNRGPRSNPYLVVRCDIPLPAGTDHVGRLQYAVIFVARQADRMEREFLGLHHDLGVKHLE